MADTGKPEDHGEQHSEGSATVYRLPAARYQILYDHSPGLMCTVDSTGHIASINAYGANKLGYRVADLIGVRFLDLHAEPSQALVKRQLSSTGATSGDTRRWEAEMLRRNDGRLWVRAHGRWTHSANRSLEMLVVAEDVTDARDVQDELRRQASVDALTGLMNRRTFSGRIQDVIERMATGQHHTLGYVDLDRFKLINDSCGHDAGDRLLRQLAGLMRNKLRNRDMLARLGGDEFAFLLEHCPLEQAERIAGELLAAVNDYRFHWDGDSYNVGMSIGLTSIRGTGGDAAQMLASADAACRDAKASGRNCVRVYVPASQSDPPEDRHWAERLRDALARDLFVLHFQPVYRLASETHPGSLSGYEVLLRLRGDAQTLLQPRAFLSAAERFEIAPALDIWVLQHTIEKLRSEPQAEAGTARPTIYLNLSRTTMSSAEYLREASRILADAPAIARRLCFELDERDVVTDAGQAGRFIAALRALGCQIALDNFGSGLSAFNLLRTLAPDQVKIDSALIQSISGDDMSLRIVEAIGEISHSLGISAIATGVEHQQVLEHLGGVRIDHAQGYLLGEPRDPPAEESV